VSYLTDRLVQQHIALERYSQCLDVIAKCTWTVHHGWPHVNTVQPYSTIVHRSHIMLHSCFACPCPIQSILVNVVDRRCHTTRHETTLSLELPREQKHTVVFFQETAQRGLERENVISQKPRQPNNNAHGMTRGFLATTQ